MASGLLLRPQAVQDDGDGALARNIESGSMFDGTRRSDHQREHLSSVDVHPNRSDLLRIGEERSDGLPEFPSRRRRGVARIETDRLQRADQCILGRRSADYLPKELEECRTGLPRFGKRRRGRSQPTEVLDENGFHQIFLCRKVSKHRRDPDSGPFGDDLGGRCSPFCGEHFFGHVENASTVALRVGAQRFVEHRKPPVVDD